ncbi:hypothetical protein GCM10027277_26340 [Pseudoduganella ginsengisoli]|uniref:Uncharacterized protein n=1 Tax=Pseudoduganella ginsengisoli TaxID=1462440 RepID=A0A6L6Q2A7_9BURK|nr:hypothetical protein [Pseudoduganella ginsengisoli]MTW03559.1 hypothetical protein [Pseudoduganella ginsengisoli]
MMIRRPMHVFLFFFALLGGILVLALSAATHSASNALLGLGCLAGAMAMLPNAFPVVAEGAAASVAKQYSTIFWLLNMACLGVGHAWRLGWL